MNCSLGKPWRWVAGCCALEHQLKIFLFYVEEGGKKKKKKGRRKGFLCVKGSINKIVCQVSVVLLLSLALSAQVMTLILLQKCPLEKSSWPT